MKKVLVATPLRDGAATTNYIKSLIPAVQLQLPGFVFDFAVCDTGSVNFARNDIGWEAEKGGFDLLVMIDSDMLYSTKQLIRLLSHDVDFVAGLYSKRAAGKPKWLVVPKKGAEVRPDGLIECVRVATGFQCMRVSCLKRLREVFPEREFLAQETPDGPVTTRMEYFPMGVVGPRTADVRMKKVKEVLKLEGDPNTKLNMIHDAIYSEQPAGILKGEDFYSDSMLREAGYQLFLDTGIGIVSHVGSVTFPVTTDMVGYHHGEPIILPEGEDDGL